MSPLSLTALSHPAVRAPAARPQRAARLPRTAVAGSFTDDPETTRENKEKKHKETFWAEPSNKNPLEKSTMMRETGPGISSQQEAEGTVARVSDEVSEKVGDFQEKLSEGASSVGQAVQESVNNMKAATDKAKE